MYSSQRQSVLIVLLLTLLWLLPACGFRDTGDDSELAAREGSSAPEIPSEPDEQGRVPYTPSKPSPTLEQPPEVDIEENTPKCKVEDFTYEIPGEDVDTESVDFLYRVVEFTESEDLGYKFLFSDHIHLLGVELVREDDHPEGLEFVDWIRMYLDDPNSPTDVEIAWGSDLSGRSYPLTVDGGLDLRPYIPVGGKVDLRARVRARSPKEDTSLKGIARFRRFYECEGEEM